MHTSRLPLTQPIESRGPDVTKDSRSVNCYFETRDQKRELVKRPGLDFAVQLATTTLPTTIQAQGLAEFGGYIIAVVNNVVYKVDPVSYVSTTLGTISSFYEQVYFNKDFNNQHLFFHTNQYFYVIDSTFTLTQLTNTSVANATVVVNGSGFTTTSTVTFTPPGTGVTATGTATISGGAIIAVTINNPGSGYTSPPTFTVTGGSVAASGTTTLNVLPTGLYSGGVVFLDQYIFVGAGQNRIYNSYLNDCTKWDALSYVTFAQSSDSLIGIAKHLNYLVAFGEFSLQMYYDAGTYPGSPLALAPTYMSEVGLISPNSLVQSENTLFWVGRSKANGPAVYIMDGTSPVRVSTHSIEKYLQESTLADLNAYVIKVNGHLLYILTINDLNVTMVFDAVEHMWYQWTMWSVGQADTGANGTSQPNVGILCENYFRPTFYCSVNGNTFVLDDDLGTLYKLDLFTYTDNGAPIYVRSVTDLVDNGNTKRKFFNRVEVIGDKVSASAFIRHTDDDYQTWSKYREVDLGSSRSQFYCGGASRRRAYELLCTDAVPLRLDALEVDFSLGELDEQSQGVQTPYRK